MVRFGLLTWVLLMMVPASVEGGSANDPPPSPPSPIAAGCQQILLVRAASWTAATGTLERYERSERSERSEGSTWTRVGAAIPVDLGRNGMAWGRGLQMMTEPGPVKREGDGKSPAGVYRLGTAFGAAVSLPAGARDFPYLRALPTTYCVEDARSIYYNQFVDSTRVTPPSWEQWSQMARADGLFEWGVVVQQNAPEIQRGAGSCVFLHIWRGPNRPTAGCTAMAKDHIQETLRWLNPDLAPILVQLPEPVFRSVRAAWGLPKG
jgi:L,D-peptidoglycan transpeptidase YkuD (ErfK/YbiS/YcfS/YnhG family)